MTTTDRANYADSARVSLVRYMTSEKERADYMRIASGFKDKSTRARYEFHARTAEQDRDAALEDAMALLGLVFPEATRHDFAEWIADDIEELVLDLFDIALGVM